MFKKLFFLFLILVFSSACSLGGSGNREYKPTNLDKLEDLNELNNLAEEDSSNYNLDKREINKRGINKNYKEPVFYRNNNYRFQIELPQAWYGYLVEIKNTNYSSSFGDYNVDSIIFGLPIKISEKNNRIEIEDCDSCFEELFSIFILDQETSKKLEEVKQIDISQNKNNILNWPIFSFSSNINYVFYAPVNFYGHSFDGNFIEARKKDARNAVYNNFITWNSFDFSNNNIEHILTQENYISNNYEIYISPKFNIKFKYAKIDPHHGQKCEITERENSISNSCGFGINVFYKESNLEMINIIEPLIKEENRDYCEIFSDYSDEKGEYSYYIRPIYDKISEEIANGIDISLVDGIGTFCGDYTNFHMGLSYGFVFNPNYPDRYYIKTYGGHEATGFLEASSNKIWLETIELF